MKLLLLGTGGYHPTDTRQTACLMLPELGIVLDAGTGFYRVGEHLSTAHLDVYLSHAHLDHVIGLTFLFDVLWQRSDTSVTVHGTAQTIDAVKKHVFATEVFPVMPPMNFRELAPTLVLPEKGTLRHFPLVHPGGATGFRLDWPNRSLAYVTDTTAAADADYIDAIRGVDVLVHECYFDDDQPDRAALTGHSCVTSVAMLAQAADVKRLVLVHVNPLGDAQRLAEKARQTFPDVILATDRMELDF